jgi:hypothetical protein
MPSALRDFPESQAAEENLTQAYPMAAGWHTRSSTGGLAELRFDHFKEPTAILWVAGGVSSPCDPLPDAAMFASCIHPSAIFHWTGAYPQAANVEAPTFASLSGLFMTLPY